MRYIKTKKRPFAKLETKLESSRARSQWRNVALRTIRFRDHATHVKVTRDGPALMIALCDLIETSDGHEATVAYLVVVSLVLMMPLCFVVATEFVVNAHKHRPASSSKEKYTIGKLTRDIVSSLSLCPASLCACRTAASLRPMLDGFGPQCTSTARNAGTVSAAAGSGAMPQSLHHKARKA